MRRARTTCPPNVRLIEFFVEPGSALGSGHRQQNVLCENYTHVAREIVARGVNVIAQLVAQRSEAGALKFSLGSNPDVTLDLLSMLHAERATGRKVVCMAQTHAEMPFMLGAAVVPPETFDLVLDEPRYQQRLFCPPNPALGNVDHAIGLHVSALIADGGTLQIGIGELGDAICNALLLRHQQNAAWRRALADVGAERHADVIDAVGGREAFREGLFASTEMLVDQMLDLWRAGILCRRVYDSLPLTRLIESGEIRQQGSDRFGPDILDALPRVGVSARLSAAEFADLQHHGVFRAECHYENGRIRAPDGQWIEADLLDGDSVLALKRSCLGRELRNGVVAEAGFLLGPQAFYAALRALPDSERREFNMRGVGWINQLYGEGQELRMLQRRRARFVNSTMMVTALGAAVSDGLDDGRVVSGVGGQYNFVAMAHALPGARSVICLRATRRDEGRLQSNIRWQYGHATIPRHLRDIVVTEYGIADLRGRTDAECIAALVAVADSRFQADLVHAARRAGKLSADFVIPDAARQNLPDRLASALASHQRASLFGEYPFGTDLNGDEIVLARALRHLRAATSTRPGRALAIAATIWRPPGTQALPLLRRLGLERPAGIRELALQRLVARSIARTR